MALIALNLCKFYAKFKANICEIFSKFNAKLCKIYAKFNAKFCTIYAKFNAKLCMIYAKFNAKLCKIYAKFNAKICKIYAQNLGPGIFRCKISFWLCFMPNITVIKIELRGLIDPKSFDPLHQDRRTKKTQNSSFNLNICRELQFFFSCQLIFILI